MLLGSSIMLSYPKLKILIQIIKVSLITDAYFHRKWLNTVVLKLKYIHTDCQGIEPCIYKGSYFTDEGTNKPNDMPKKILVEPG